MMPRIGEGRIGEGDKIAIAFGERSSGSGGYHGDGKTNKGDNGAGRRGNGEHVAPARRHAGARAATGRRGSSTAMSAGMARR